MLPRTLRKYMRMLTISKPLSEGQVRTYHEREFASDMRKLPLSQPQFQSPILAPPCENHRYE